MRGTSMARAVSPALEPLERRTLLTASDPIISEFMADNTNGLVDGLGHHGDWIEIYNPGASSVNMQGWHLTDTQSNPNLYTFPSLVVPAGGYKVVFATSETTPFVDAAGYPHTNFSLSKGGEYLALSKPDGTITTGFAPSFPPQTSNVSYGTGPGSGVPVTLLNTGAPATTFVPTGSGLGTSWTGPGFNDSSWTAVSTGIGYEVNASNVPVLTQENDTLNGGNNDRAHADDATTSFAAYSGNLYQLGFTGAIGSGSDSDYFNIGALQNGDVITVTVSGSGATPLSDSVVELYRAGSSGSPVVSDDNTGPGNDALVHRFTVTTNDTYYIRVRANSSLTGGYRVGVRLENSGSAPSTGGSSTSESESNNSIASADNLSSSWRAVDYQSHIGGGTNFGSSQDWFKYQFTAGDLVTVYLNSTSSTHGTVALTDAAGNVLVQENGTSTPATDTLDSYVYSFIVPSTGTYYLRTVKTGSTTGSYNFDVYLSSTTRPPHPANFSGQYASGVQSGMFGVNATDYLRVPFNVADPAAITSLILKMKYDDGFVAYLNGTEIARRNAGGTAGTPLAFNAAAASDRAPGSAVVAEDIDIFAFRSALVAGNNVLAIQGLNSSASSDDFLMVPQITGSVESGGALQYFYTPTPGAANIPGAGVVINEIHYDPDIKTERVEFIELLNNSTVNVNISGWQFTKGITYTFPNNTTVAPGQYLVIAQDSAAFQAKFGSAAFGQFTGSLSNGGDTLRLTDAALNTIDQVEYGAGFPWPTVGDALGANGTGPSIQLINPGMDNDLGGDWRSALPTPGRQNSVFASNAAPAIRQVVNGPTSPTSGQPVTITAKVTDPDGVNSVNLLYQVNAPGNYVSSVIVNTSNWTTSHNPAYDLNWVNVPMYDDGTHGDTVAGDGVYAAQIPPAVNQNRTLIRYKVSATDGLGASITAPFADDPSLNFAYYVYDGVPGWSAAIDPGSSNPALSQVVNYSPADMNRLQVYQVIANNKDVIDSQHIPPSTAGAYSGNVELWRGAFYYNGTVYDNVAFRTRGGSAWRYAMGKNKWEFNFNRNNGFQAYDNYGNPYKTKWDNFTLNAIIQQGNYWHRGEQGMFEAINLKLFNLVGVAANNTQWVQFRVVDDSQEAPADNQYGGDLWGMYLAMEQDDGNFLDEHGLPDGNLYRMNPEDGGAGGGTLNNQGATQVSNNSDLVDFTNTYKNTTPTDEWWEQNLDLEEYYSYRTIVEGVHHYDIDQGAGKNYFYYHNPDTGQWEVLPWDSDLSWSDNMYGGGNEPFRDRVLPRADFNIDYKNRIREIRDLLFNTDQAYNLLDEYANIIDPPGVANAPVDWDRAMWDYNPILDPSTGYTYGDKGGLGRFYAGSPANGIVIPAPGGFRGMVQKMKNYIVERSGVLDSLAADNLIPAKPTASYRGAAGFPVDQLSFSTTPFSSGNSSFAAMEWRIGETYDPTNPTYSPTGPRPYEITSVWESGELSSFNSTISVPASRLDAGHTYRLRVRFKDANGRWSNWSSPVQFIAGQPGSSVVSDLRVTEIMYHPAEPEAGSTYTADDFEYVEVMNRGTAPLDLTGVKFTQGIDFTFADGYTLAPGERALVVKNLDAFQSRYGHSFDSMIAGAYAGKSLSNSGDHIRLEGPVGQTILDFSYDNTWLPQTDGQGFSMVIIDPNADASAWGDKDSWRASKSVGGDPTTDVPNLTPNSVVVNEILANPATPNQTWIEIHNTTSDPVDLSNWFLSDDAANLKKYAFDAGTIIPAGGFLVLDEQTSYGLGAGAFTLSRLGGSAYLSQAGAAGNLLGYRDTQDYGPSDVGVTVGRYVKSSGKQDFTALSSASRAADNAQPAVGPIVINEVMYNPAGGGGTEYVELRNVTGAPVDISGWTFEGISFTFSAGTVVPAWGYVLVLPVAPASGPAVPAATQVFGPYSGLLDDAGEDLRLLRPGTPLGSVTPYITVDHVSYSSTGDWPSAANGTGASLYRRDAQAYGNDVASWVAASGTPGRPNILTTATGELSLETRDRVTITFTEDVSGDLSSDALTVENLSGGSVPSMTYSWDLATLTATWQFNGPLDDANYRATLHGDSVHDWAGTAIDGNRDSLPGGDYDFEFFSLGGDANHDRAVDFNDLVKLAQHYNTVGGNTYADGDFTGDGNVDFSDLVILAQHYNLSLPAGGAAALSATASAMPSLAEVLSDLTPVPPGAPVSTPAKPAPPMPRPKPAAPVAKAAPAPAPAPAAKPQAPSKPVSRAVAAPPPFVPVAAPPPSAPAPTPVFKKLDRQQALPVFAPVAAPKPPAKPTGFSRRRIK
jgi:hypothetical protein